MPEGLTEIHARLRAADLALARVRGGSSELAQVREATGSLLVAMHELVALYEKRALSIGGLDIEGPFTPEQKPPRRARRSHP